MTTYADESSHLRVEPAASQPAASQPAPIGPNWFASVMGTGIVSIAAAVLPVAVPTVISAIGGAP